MLSDFERTVKLIFSSKRIKNVPVRSASSTDPVTKRLKRYNNENIPAKGGEGNSLHSFAYIIVNVY